MPTYWDGFIMDYGNKLHYKSMATVLEAFFYYAKNDVTRCEEILNVDRGNDNV